MGLFGIFGDKRSQTAKNTVLVQMTDIGRMKLEKQQATGKEYDILSTMVTVQPCIPSEISDRMGHGMTESKVIDVLRAMKAKGWITDKVQ